MNNDLISREALKKAVEDLVAGGAERLKEYYENGSKKEENEWIGGVYDAWELICDAPTVEYPFYQEAYQTGYEEGKNDRPKGKWEVYGRQGDIPITDMCSNCKYEMKWYRNKYNYCPNCGAYMRKGDRQ